jgi:hypothetical protein
LGPRLAFRAQRIVSGGGSNAGGECDGANGLNEPTAADEPAICVPHRVTDELAVRLRDVALDERAGVQIEVQRSASRSASTTVEALREPLAT